MFLDKQFSDFTARSQVHGKSLEYVVTVLGEETNSQCFLLEESIGKANLHLTASRLREMSIPGMEQEFHEKSEQNRLEGNPDRFLLICHDFEAFVNIPMDRFHQHWVVNSSG